MSHLDPAQQEDAALQADPVLTLSGGPTTWAQIVVCVIAGTLVVLSTLYGLTRQGGAPATPTFQAARAALPAAVREAMP